MTVLADFSTIIENNPVTISDRPFTTKPFNTGGREKHGAFLVFRVRGLTKSSEKPSVSIRGAKVTVGDTIQPYPGGNPQYWHTQIIYFPGDALRDGNNTVRIGSVPNDSFEVKNMVCFFKQDDGDIF